MGINAILDPHNWSAVPFHFWSLVFFVFGCMWGSFLNVCIYRMPLGISVVSPPSHCPHCKYSIPWFLNMPLVTWLALGGKCKNCGAPISARYFLVELLTGLMFLACWLAYGHHSAWVALSYCFLTAVLITATFIDFEHFIIPDEITYGGMVIGFICSLAAPALHGKATMGASVLQSILGMVVGAGLVYGILRAGKLLFGRQRIELPANTKIYFSETDICFEDKQIAYEELLYRKTDTIVLRAHTLELVDRCYRDVEVKLRRTTLEIGEERLDPEKVIFMEATCSQITLPREAMGLGDVKFMAAIGAFVGWQATIFSLMASSIIGSAVGIILIIGRKREWSSRLPYGPYIAAAAVVYIFLPTAWQESWRFNFRFLGNVFFGTPMY